MSKDTVDKLTPDILKHMMLDHMSNTMSVPVDRDYAEHLLDRLLKSEVLSVLEELEGTSKFYKTDVYLTHEDRVEKIPAVPLSEIKAIKERYQ